MSVRTGPPRRVLGPSSVLAAIDRGRAFLASSMAFALAVQKRAHADRDLAYAGLRVSEFVKRRWAELSAAVLVLVLLIYLVHVLTRFALPPSGDSGQWLTISRYYLREAMPAERSATTMPPLVPIALGAFSLVSPTRPFAVVMLAAVSFVALSAVSFLLGKRLTGAASGGLLAVVFIMIAQPQLFEVIAVGAYPQLVAMIGMAVCLLALLMLAGSSAQRGWTVLQGGVALTLFSHTPSATTLMPPLAICLVYIGWSSTDRRATVRNGYHALRPVVLLWAAFILINRDVVFGYANVPATFEIKGPDRLLSSIWRDDAQRLMVGFGAFMLLLLPILSQAPRSLKSNQSIMLLLWTAMLAGTVILAAARHVNTDYPRFIAYFIVPLGLAAAAGLQTFKPSLLAVGCIVVGAGMFAGQPALAHLDESARFYGLNGQSDELIATTDWLNDSGEDGGVIGGTRDTKWLQALTGRSALLYLRRVSITRPWEVDRAIAAEVVQRSSGGFETGRVLVTQNTGGQDYGKLFPAGVRIDAYHLGMYDETIALDDRATRVRVSTYGVAQNVPLGALEITSSASSETVDGVSLSTRFASEKNPLRIVREASAEGAEPGSVIVDYHIGAPAGLTVESLSIAFKDAPTMIIRDGSPETAIDARMFDGSNTSVGASTGWAKSNAPEGEDATLLWRRVRLVLTFPPGERRLPTTRLYDPATVLQQYGIRYIVDRDGDGAPFPIIRDYGLVEVHGDGGTYHIYESPVR